MSGDPEQEYFADGMVEDIITALSRIRWLFVIARNSSFTYKGHAVDVKQVGRELGVRYVLEGSVRKAGDRVRITGQLIDAATGAHLWADRFDGRSRRYFRAAGRDHRQRRRRDRSRACEEPKSRAPRTSPPAILDAYDLYASRPCRTCQSQYSRSPVRRGDPPSSTKTLTARPGVCLRTRPCSAMPLGRFSAAPSKRARACRRGIECGKSGRKNMPAAPWLSAVDDKTLSSTYAPGWMFS